MSQIPRSQFALKKRQSPMVTIPVLDHQLDQQNGAKPKKATNGSSNGNGYKSESFDNDVVIIEDDCLTVVGQEVVIRSSEVAAKNVEVPTPTKKKRSRKSKDSTESKDSEIAKKIEETAAKSAEKVAKEESVEEVAPATQEFKILKMTEGAPLSSKRRSDRLTNASTIVNLSTVSSSDQSTKIISDETLQTPTVERRVSGRRSTRPIDDIKFSYRTPNPDDSFNGTTNATIGSDVSLLMTPGGKRPFTDSTENIDTPKRSRMDLSGLFSSFSSPVTLLRNKFRRTNLASTPVVGLEAPFVDMDSSEGQMKEVDLNEQSEEAAPATEEELKVITTPVKKSLCSIM